MVLVDWGKSKILSNFLASPPEICIRDSVSFKVIFNLLKTSSSVFALSSNSCKSSLDKDSNTYTCERESRAEITSKEGFSVVAPISVITPFSTAPNNESC